MALINPSDVTMTLLPETTIGVLPTTGSRYELPISNGTQIATFVSNDVMSNTKRPGRASNGSRPGMVTGTGTLDMRLQSAAVINIILESALSGKFTTSGTKTLKGSGVDSTFSLLALLQDGATGAALLEQASGCMVSKVTIAGKYGEGVTMSVDYLSVKPDTLNTNPTGPTIVSLPNTAYEFMGGDAGGLTIGGLASFQPTSFSLEINQNRTPRGLLFTNNPLGIGTQDTRGVKLSVGGYRTDFGPEAAILGNPQAVALTVGGVGNGYGFYLPGANGVRPKTNLDGESALVELEFNSKYDNTRATDFYITQL